MRARVFRGGDPAEVGRKGAETVLLRHGTEHLAELCRKATARWLELLERGRQAEREEER